MMNGKLRRGIALGLAAVLWIGAGWIRGDEANVKVAADVNKKMVKIFGSGGFKGLPSYGTGVVISPDGLVLTVASHLLDTQDLRVHTYDGRRFSKCKVLVVEPTLDAALIKIENVSDLPYFDAVQAAKAPLAKPGDWILAFSNQFQIATRDEPMSVQRGVIAAYTKLHGRRGVHDAPYNGDVYVIDAICNNPGAGGGVITNRKGELLGVIGKELRNTLSDTWINYAVPITVLGEFIEKGAKGEWKVREKPEVTKEGGHHGITLVYKAVERTPPFVESVLPDSPAAKAGVRPDDLIVYVNGEAVPSINAFNELVSKWPEGTEVTLDVLRREGEERSEKLVTITFKLDKPLKAPKKPATEEPK